MRKAPQGIDCVAIRDCYATETVVLEAKAASGQDIEFALAGDGSGVLDGNALAFTGEGTVMVVAIQLGDELWNWSVVGQPIYVSKMSQSIEFVPIVSQSVDETLSLEATAGSGLPVAYEVEGPAKVVGNIVSFTEVGIVMVTARLGGNALWT